MTMDNKKRNVMSVLSGLLAGVVMALMMLYIMMLSDFKIVTVTLILQLLVACALPLCLQFLKKQKLSVLVAGTVMIVLSFLITVLYGFVVDRQLEYRAVDAFISRVILLTSLLHGSALVSLFLFGKK